MKTLKKGLSSEEAVALADKIESDDRLTDYIKKHSYAVENSSLWYGDND